MFGYLVLSFFVGLVSAIICARMAIVRERDESSWAIAGFFFGIPAVLILALVGDSNEKKARLLADAIKKAQQ